MNKKNVLQLTTFILITFWVALSSAVTIPNMTNYQGRLLDNNGIPVTQTNVSIEISLWDDLVSISAANKLTPINR